MLILKADGKLLGKIEITYSEPMIKAKKWFVSLMANKYLLLIYDSILFYEAVFRENYYRFSFKTAILTGKIRFLFIMIN